MVAQRGQCLHKSVVPVPAGRDDPYVQAEPVDQMLDPFAQVIPGLWGFIGQQGWPVCRPPQVAELSRKRVPTRCHGCWPVVHSGIREAEPSMRRPRRSTAMMPKVAVALPVLLQDGCASQRSCSCA